MCSRRKMRRIAGWLVRYLSDDLMAFGAKADGRSRRGRRWKQAEPLLKMTLLGLLAGCKGIGEVERLSGALPLSVRRKLGIPKRIPDTTLRGLLVKLDPMALHDMLCVVGYDAQRRKALRHRDELGIPFGVLSADGKYPSIAVTEPYEYLQVHHQDGEPTHGLLRTVTCCLVTALGRPVLGALPLDGSTNEQGGFKSAFHEMVKFYGPLFRLLMYDAGAASSDNADAVKDANKDYLFLVADPRWKMYETIELLLRDQEPAVVEEEISGNKRVVRKLTMRSVKATKKNLLLWKHTRTIFRIDYEVYEGGELVGCERRFSVTSLEAGELSAESWLRLHVLRWGVETVHGILDTSFEEDKRPWIRKSAQGHLAVQLLRRVAYTLMTLYKHVTIRNEDESAAPWRQHFEWFKDVLKWATADDLVGLRPRTYAVPPALA